MDPKFVSLLIQEILSTTQCPKCGAEVAPSNVEVQQINANQCKLIMQCSHCKKKISANAYVSKEGVLKQVKEKQPQNTQKQNLKKRPQRVSLDEVMLMQKFTHNFSGNLNQYLK